MIYEAMNTRYYVDGERVSRETYMLHNAIILLKDIEGALTKRGLEAQVTGEAASQVASEEQVKVNWANFASSPELTSVRTKYQNYLLANKRGPTHVDLSEDVYNNLRRLEPTVVKHTKEGKIFVMGAELIQPLNPGPSYCYQFLVKSSPQITQIF